MKKSALLAASLTLVTMTLGLVLFAFFRARIEPGEKACISNLHQLDGAKDQWATDDNKTTNDSPTWDDLDPYLRRKLACPQGGNYAPGRVGEPPRCSLGGPRHSVPR